jgi:hypothetical protein
MNIKLYYLSHMAKAKKIKKERPKKYEPKFAVKGNFADVFKVVKKNKEDNLNKKP